MLQGGNAERHKGKFGNPNGVQKELPGRGATTAAEVEALAGDVGALGQTEDGKQVIIRVLLGVATRGLQREIPCKPPKDP